MRRRALLSFALLLTATAIAPAAAQQDGTPVPRAVRFNAVLSADDGTPIAGAVVLRFAIYAEMEGGEPLWSETQTIVAGPDGRYSVLLGATQPMGLSAVFADGRARWLGVQAEGRPEQPRAALVSVPYAFKAADAETVGGRPLSAFVLAGDKTGIGADGLTYVDTRVLGSGLTGGGSGPPSPSGGAGTANYLPVYLDTTNLANSVLYQAPGTNYLGVGTAAPLGAFHSAAEGTTGPGVWYDTYTNTPGYMPVAFRMARGTKTSPLPIQANDILGGLMVRGYGSTGFGSGIGQIRYQAAENFTDARMGTFLTMTTTPVGSNLWAERLRITSDGKVGIGTAAPAQALSVAGVVESTAGGFKYPDGSTATTAAPYGSIAGTLVSCNPSDVVSGRFVVIPGQSFMAYTDANGAFKLSSVVPGSYLLAAPDFQRTQSVNVSAGLETNVAAFRTQDLQTNTSHCGACGVACSTLPNTAGPLCVNGSCALGACVGWYRDCDTQLANGCEANTQVSATNCGSCGTACATYPNTTGPSCVNGACATSCSAGFANCNSVLADGCEINTSNNVSNCGACGRVCGGLPNSFGILCTGGTCGFSGCNAGFGNCNNNPSDGCEINLATSVTNCGACGTVCPVRANTTAAVCANGACGMGNCITGYANCNGLTPDGCEVNVMNDSRNCGGCGRACAVGLSCISGACGAPAPSFFQEGQQR